MNGKEPLGKGDHVRRYSSASTCRRKEKCRRLIRKYHSQKPFSAERETRLRRKAKERGTTRKRRSRNGATIRRRRRRRGGG